MLLYGLLIADGVLLILVLIAATIRFCKSNKEDAKANPDVEKILIEQQNMEEEEQALAEPEQEPVAPIEEKEPEPVATEEVVAKETAVAVAEEDALIIGDVEEDGNDKKGVPFAEKILSLDKTVQDYYDVINNAFNQYRRVHGRVSQKGVSYRLGRDLIAKMTIRGKTLRLNLALEPKDFEEGRYFQKDMRDVKAYVEIPFMVKVRSDRGLKRAIELIDALVEKEKIEKKVRYFPVDSIENLKNLKK